LFFLSQSFHWDQITKFTINLTLSSDIGGEAETVEDHLDGVMAYPAVIARDVVTKCVHLETMC
jgi:hypothetical protein